MTIKGRWMGEKPKRSKRLLVTGSPVDRRLKVTAYISLDVVAVLKTQADLDGTSLSRMVSRAAEYFVIHATRPPKRKR